MELTGTPAQVYNFRIADHHTYFVGDDDWGFSVWVHNNNYSRNRASMPIDEAIESGALSVKGSRAPTHFDGKTGKPSTQLQNMELMAELESRGWTVTNGAAPGYTEEFIPGIGGLLSSSPDITAVKVFRRRERVLRINTVTIDSKGVPIDGELSQAIRIRHFGALKDARGTAHLLLVPKRS